MFGDIMRFAVAVLLSILTAISSISAQEADSKCGPRSLLTICELLCIEASLEDFDVDAWENADTFSDLMLW